MNWRTNSDIKKELRQRSLDRMEDRAMWYFLALILALGVFSFGGNLLGYLIG